MLATRTFTCRSCPTAPTFSDRAQVLDHLTTVHQVRHAPNPFHAARRATLSTSVEIELDSGARLYKAVYGWEIAAPGQLIHLHESRQLRQ